MWSPFKHFFFFGQLNKTNPNCNQDVLLGHAEDILAPGAGAPRRGHGARRGVTGGARVGGARLPRALEKGRHGRGLPQPPWCAILEKTIIFKATVL